MGYRGERSNLALHRLLYYNSSGLPHFVRNDVQSLKFKDIVID